MGLPFVGFVLVLDWYILKTKVVQTRQCWYVMTILMILTAFFDQFLTGLPIVTYDTTKLLGVYLGTAPIEDFLYTFVAVIGLGSLQAYYEK
jgi:lycopene cyclase domain-containing protein